MRGGSLERREFMKIAALAAAAARSALVQGGTPAQGGTQAQGGSLTRLKYPLAIAMWDFSWLERRWPGAGYEDWDSILDELKKRGYDAVRIDAYPHLVATAADRTWELLPCWNQQVWGSPARNRVRVQPELNQFIRKCADRGLRVALSTWFRQDADDTRMKIRGPEDHGRIWKTTLDSIAANGLLPHILYVDLCNEFPLSDWAPFLPPNTERANKQGKEWMRDAIAVVRRAYPGLDFTFSITTEYDALQQQDVSMLDFLEAHIWMTQWTTFYDEVGYNYERFDPKGYDNLAERGKKIYLSNPDHWKAGLASGIQTIADWSRATRKPLVTTECWAVIDYKDWPLLEWDWVKELCELGVRTASATGRWLAMATSNFCGPQFVGMWRDVSWHQRLTEVIHQGPLHLDQPKA